MKTKYDIGQKIDLDSTIVKISASSVLGENNKVNEEIFYELRIKLGKDHTTDVTIRETSLDYQLNQGRLVILKGQ